MLGHFGLPTQRFFSVAYRVASKNRSVRQFDYTYSIVDLMLIPTVMTCGLLPALSVAIVAGCGKGLGALIAAAAAKCFVLYIGIVQIAIPVFLELLEQQAAVSFNMFSISQLITGFVGGALAVVLFPMEWSFQIIPWH